MLCHGKALACIPDLYTPPSFARMLGSLTRLRPQLAAQALSRIVGLSVPHSRHATSVAPSSGPKRLRVDYWKDHPRLAYTDKYPLTRELAALGPRPDPIHKTKTPRLQTQIVSPELCGMSSPGAGDTATDVLVFRC